MSCPLRRDTIHAITTALQSDTVGLSLRSWHSMQADTLHAYLESVFYKLGDDPVLTASQDSITKKGLVNSLPDITAINEIT